MSSSDFTLTDSDIDSIVQSLNWHTENDHTLTLGQLSDKHKLSKKIEALNEDLDFLERIAWDDEA